MPEVKCGVCSTVARVGEAAVGKTVNCPRCNELLRVPGKPARSRS